MTQSAKPKDIAWYEEAKMKSVICGLTLCAALSTTTRSAAADDVARPRTCVSLAFDDLGPRDGTPIPQWVISGPTGYKNIGDVSGRAGTISIRQEKYDELRKMVTKKRGYDGTKDGAFIVECEDDKFYAFVIDRKTSCDVAGLIRAEFEREKMPVPPLVRVIESAAVAEGSSACTR